MAKLYQGARGLTNGIYALYFDGTDKACPDILQSKGDFVDPLTRQAIEDTISLVGSRHITLAGMDLRHLEDLANMNLEGANFNETRLDGINFSGANLKGAKFDSAMIRGAMLEKAELQGANLFKADLRKADLSGAFLQKAYLGSANLQDAIFHEADLTEANLQFADMRGADLREAIVTSIDLKGVRYDEHTIWPEKLDPRLVGAVYARR